MCQIHNKSFKFNTFVGNCISEILSNSSIDDWLWVSSDENVADLVSCGCVPAKLSEDTVWQRGTNFMSDIASEWPEEKTSNVDLTDFVYN